MGNATTKDYSKSISVGTNSRKTRWDGPGLPAPPGKPILISGTDETQPDVVAIRWERSPSNGGSAIVGYLVEHRRLGSPHWIRSSSGLCAFPELTLSGLEPGWRYQFRVRAQNAVGLSRPSEISEPLTVTLQRVTAACAPHFDLELKDTTVLENEQAEFVVQFSGTPLPKISWFKDGFEIFSSRRTRIITDNGKSVLLIHQTALNDEGEIKCTATNRAGHIATRAKLILEASPRIRLPRQYEDGLLFEQDETIRLKVSLAGKPPPTIIWYHDGELISKDARHVFEVMDGESILKIPEAKRNDRGEYTIKATNKLGEDAASFLVTVTDRPAPPGKVAVSMTLGRSVTLSWKEPEDDGGCKIGTYIVEYYRIGWEVWLKATTSRSTSATLTELIEGSEYKFRVKAENPYGVSDPSEESDVIFIPDLKRRIVTPSLSEKSQSHREISRSRGDRREVSFTTPAQRTRSLTREEARTRNDEGIDRFGYDERSASIQRLATPISTLDRPSRADSRVTFAPDILEKEQPPVPPARSRDHASTKQQVSLGNHTDRSNIAADTRDKQDIVVKRERTMSPKPTVTVSSPVEEDFNLRSISTTKERRSLSPLSIPRIQEPQREENSTAINHHLLSSANSILRRQTAIINESVLSPQDSLQLQKQLSREDDEDVLHGSSEFMLVLYPDEMMEEENVIVANGTSYETRINSKQDMIELTEEENDLIPPPMSLSLPELFSAQHQIVEVMRLAVSSTELLHERAMERFYRAVAAEEASEIAKQKTQLERQTGELALLNVESIQKSSLRRRLSSSSVTTQNLIVSWRAKKNRRRSSEGQTEAAPKTMKLLSPALLLDVEARSDPNLPSETTRADSWRRSDEDESVKRLRRWHEANVPLLEEVQEEKSIRMDDEEGIASIIVNRAKEIKEEEINSIETSEESSEEISSADSEDLKLLRSRILARRVMDEEDTYHPRGRPVPHVEPELPQISYDRTISLEISSPPPVRAVTPVSPNNVVPKSILKKPKEEMIPPDNFVKSIPPEKPIRKIPPQPYEQENIEKINIDIEERITDFSSMSEALKTPAMSESDTDSILSAAEAAKNRRMQLKLRSMTPEQEAAETEARMAVVNQYTEIVREYAGHSRHGSAASSRRSSISEDQAEQKHRVQEKLASNLMDKPEQDEMSKLKIQNKNKVDKQTKNNQAPAITRKESVNSRSTTPARDTMTAKRGKSISRDQSPAAKGRKRERTAGASSRSSSKTRNRTPSLDRNNRSLAKNDLNEQGSRRSKIPSGPSSSSSSRSNSRERYRATTSVESKVEKLQKALESNKYRAMKKESEVTKEIAGKSIPERTDGKQLALEAKNTVRSTVDYITDLTLLMAAMYVYFFKKETLAVPFIVLLLYRRIQEGIHGWMPRRWWRSTKKP